MKYANYLLGLGLTLTSLCVRAQSAEDSVKSAVNLLFTAMKTSDAGMIARSFADSRAF